MKNSNKYLEEIESLSIMLMGIIEKLVYKKKEGIIISEDNMDLFCTDICVESSFNLNEIIDAPDVKLFGGILKPERGFDETNIEITADIFVAISENAKPPVNRFFVKKALQIYEYLNIKSRKIPQDRQLKIDNLEKILDTIAA